MAGTLSLDCARNPYGISLSRTLIFGVDLNAKKAQLLGLRRHGCASLCASSDNGLVLSGVVEKEFEFKPSFEDHVKAMEDVKTVREKRRVAKSDRRKDGFLDRKRMYTDLEEDAVSGSGSGVEKVENTYREKGYYKNRELKDKLDRKEKFWGTKVKRTPRAELKSGRWWSEFEDNSVAVESRLEGGLQVLIKESPRDKRLKERVSKREEIGVRLNGRNSRFQIDPIQVDEGARDKSHYKYGRTEELKDALDANESNSSLMVGRVPRGAVENGRWTQAKENSLDSRSERTQVMLENLGTCNRPQNKKSIERRFKRKEMIVRGNGTSSRFHENPIQVEKVADKDYTSIGTPSSKSFVAEDGNLEIERAAFKYCEETADKMDTFRVSKMEMEERIQNLANCLNGADIHMPEWMFSKMMRSARIRFSDHSVLRIIQLLGKVGNWRRVLQVIEWLQLRERFKSYKLRYIYTAALHALQKARRPVEALNLFRVMQRQMDLYPDLVAYHSISVALGQAGHMKELFDVIDSMRTPPKKSFRTRALDNWDPQLEPDIIVYNAVLNACVQQNQWEGAFWVMEQLKQQGLSPSSGTYGLVMEVMFVCGKYNLVHEFFKKMQKSYVPNALTYRVLVNTLWKEGKIDEAVLVVQDMEKRRIVGSAALYYDFARCLCSAGRCEEALMQIGKICKVASKPLVVTYTGLIQACLDSGNIQNGLYIFNQMHKFCSPNLVTCNIILKAYLEHGMHEEAKKLFQKLLDNGNHIIHKLDYKTRVLPDIHTFNIMLDACFMGKRWDDFQYFYERMLYHGFQFNARRHLPMILDASNTRTGELVEIIWERLARADRIPHPALVKERFCTKLEENDHAAAMACIADHRESELPAFSKQAWLKLLEENRERFDKDSLVGLMHGLSMDVSRCDLPNPVFMNLLTSCKEHVRTHFMVTEWDF